MLMLVILVLLEQFPASTLQRFNAPLFIGSWTLDVERWALNVSLRFAAFRRISQLSTNPSQLLLLVLMLVIMLMLT